MADSTRIMVSTERLLEAADEVDLRINQMRKAFDAVEKRIENMRNYWEGDGQISSYNAYKRKTERIRTALARFSEQTNDLRVMAGVYQDTESKVTQENQKLSDNVII
ncbi:MAG: WXG100 family type VII secretion target [Eubacteriales bacterium]|nr:hypothetical protein [Sarcina sp.]MDO4416972.1 WXG100 family type VII secretion target [Eubacteriales bacterium]